MSKLVVFVVAMCVTSSLACRHTGTEIGRDLTERFAAPPPSGPTCYRGKAQLLRDTSETPPAAGSFVRRWLILDSREAVEPDGYRAAYLLTPDGRNWPVYALWQVVGDSIVIRESSTYPSANWVLIRRGDTLIGRGFMVHDVGTRDSAGNFIPAVSHWPARAERISCARVP